MLREVIQMILNATPWVKFIHILIFVAPMVIHRVK